MSGAVQYVIALPVRDEDILRKLKWIQGLMVDADPEIGPLLKPLKRANIILLHLNIPDHLRVGQVVGCFTQMCQFFAPLFEEQRQEFRIRGLGTAEDGGGCQIYWTTAVLYPYHKLMDAFLRTLSYGLKKAGAHLDPWNGANRLHVKLAREVDDRPAREKILVMFDHMAYPSEEHTAFGTMELGCIQLLDVQHALDAKGQYKVMAEHNFSSLVGSSDDDSSDDDD